MIGRLFRRLIPAIGLLLIGSMAVSGQEYRNHGDYNRHKTGPLLGISGGIFDLPQHEETAGEFRLEVRENSDWWFNALGTAMVNTDGGAFLGIGLYTEIYLTDSFYISPSFTPGVYLRGQSKNLGYPLEFRSQIELGWRFWNGVRTSVSINHISNGGLGNRNPGTESVVISFLIPFRDLF